MEDELIEARRVVVDVREIDADGHHGAVAVTVVVRHLQRQEIAGARLVVQTRTLARCQTRRYLFPYTIYSLIISFIDFLFHLFTYYFIYLYIINQLINFLSY